jgi:hypothetical protein
MGDGAAADRPAAAAGSHSAGQFNPHLHGVRKTAVRTSGSFKSVSDVRNTFP